MLNCSNGLASVRENGKYGYINTKGEHVIAPKFEAAAAFAANGLATVKENGKYGFINATGEFVIEPKFDEVSSTFCTNGLALTINANDKKMEYTDTQGQTVVSFVPRLDSVVNRLTNL